MFWHSRPSSDTTTPFVVSGRECWNYDEIFSIADDIFGALDVGLGQGLVAILCGRNMETVLGYIGALRNHIVPLMLDGELSSSTLYDTFANYEPEFVWAGASWQVGGYHEVKSWQGYALFQKKGPPSGVVNKDLALLLPTSGSTGDPKCVRLSAENIQSCSASIARYLELDESRRAVSLLPLQYSYGLSVLNATMEARGSYVICDHSPVTREFWVEMEAHAVTDFSAVPFVYEMMKRMKLPEQVMSNLVCATQAGGMLDSALTKYFFEIFSAAGVRYFTMYGQTEAAPRISYLAPEDFLLRQGSVGRPLDIGTVELFDRDDETGEGELVYKGANVCLGYAQCRSDLAHGDEFGGVLHTGDMARLDDGFITITGRKKRFVKIHGMNVNLDFVESKVRSAGFDAMVVGAEDTLVLAHPGHDNDDVLDYVKEQFNFHPRVWKIKIMDELPRTSSGKPDYATLKCAFLEE